MAKLGDKVACQIMVYVPDQPTPNDPDGYAYIPGYVSVKLLEGKHEGDLVNMVNGSVANIPFEDRVVGTLGYVRWDQYGHYHGWLWSK